MFEFEKACHYVFVGEKDYTHTWDTVHPMNDDTFQNFIEQELNDLMKKLQTAIQEHKLLFNQDKQVIFKNNCRLFLTIALKQHNECFVYLAPDNRFIGISLVLEEGYVDVRATGYRDKCSLAWEALFRLSTLSFSGFNDLSGKVQICSHVDLE